MLLLGFVSTIPAIAEPVVLFPGFVISEETTGLSQPTQITFGPDGRLYLATLSGPIYAYAYTLTGIHGEAQAVANGLGPTLLGIGFDDQGHLYASSNEGDNDTGFLARLLDEDGDSFYERIQKFVTELPNRGHHNDQIAIHGRLLYVGMGSRTDDGEQDDVEPVPAATMLRVDLEAVDFESPANLPEVFAYGLRNAFGVAIDEQGRLWAADNGRDSPLLPDELNLITEGAHYGFPSELSPPDAVEPVIELGLGTSADGMDFYPTRGPWDPQYFGNLFLARFDYELNDPAGVGRDVVRIIIEESIPNQPSAVSEVFAKGFDFPLDVEIDPFGHLLVMDFGSYDGSVPGRVFRIAPLSPADLDFDGDVDFNDFGAFQICFTGPSAEPPRSECIGLDGDADGDIDLSDYAVWQANFTGP